MLVGLVKASGGGATVLGRAAGDVATRARIGFLPEHFRFYDWLTAAELLHVHGRLYGMSRARRQEQVPALLRLVGLEAHRDKRLRDFSKGMLQRIGLAQALLNDPQLIFLDEPTSGLDPIGRRLVRDVIKAQRERGATVFLSSHLLGEVEITCDRVAFIKRGHVLEMRDIRERSDAVTRVTMRARNLSDEAISGLARWVSSVRVDGERLSFEVASSEVIPELLRYMLGRGVDVFEVTPRRLSLEERFLQIIGEDVGL
jgi:ABC-2 type transport system ATP-binding protein